MLIMRPVVAAAAITLAAATPPAVIGNTSTPTPKIAATSHHARSTHWSAILQAAGGLGTVGTFLLAGELYRRDAKRRHTDERRAQAALVGVWAADADTSELSRTDDTMRMHGRWPAIWVRNGSELPVYDWTVVADDNGTTSLSSMHLPREALAPLTSVAIALPDELTSTYSDGVLRLAIRFVDSAGRHWYRDSKGTLTEITA